MKPLNNKNNLYVADTLVEKYNTTGAFVFATIAYHITTKTTCDAAPQALANYLNCSKSTVLRYIKEFIADGLLVEVAGKHDYRKALVFSETPEYFTLFISYHNAMNGTKKADNGISIVKVNLLELPKVEGYKNEWVRKKLFFKSYMRDKLANQAIKGNQSFYSGYYTTLAKQFGFCVNTIKKIIKSLLAEHVLSPVRELGKLFIFAGHALKAEVSRKAKELQTHIIKRKPKPT